MDAIDIRKFAIEKAVAILGSGTPSKDVVSKAKEIETYIVGSAVLPEVSDKSKELSLIISELTCMLLSITNPYNGCTCGDTSIDTPTEEKAVETNLSTIKNKSKK